MENIKDRGQIHTQESTLNNSIELANVSNIPHKININDQMCGICGILHKYHR